MKSFRVKSFCINKFGVFLIILFVENPLIFYSQNIANFITNGGFEKVDDCQDQLQYIQHAYGWRTIDSIKALGVQLKTKCLNNVPKGNSSLFQYPYKGISFGHATFYCLPPFCSKYYSRSHFRNRLQSVLKFGTTYCVKLYYNVGNGSSYGISNISVFFGDNMLDTIKYAWNPLPYLNPQINNPHGLYATDTLNWIALTGTFTAQGTEKHMVIGNFTPDSLVDSVQINNTTLPIIGSEICIDHVSCIPIDLPAYGGPNKNCIIGDSVFIGREPDVEIDESCIWYKLNANGSLSGAIDTVAGLYVKPASTTTYVVKQQLWCSGVKWDTVVVYQDFVGIKSLDPNNYGGLNFKLELLGNKLLIENTKQQTFTLQIIDAVGKTMYRQKLNATFENIDLSPFAKGIYLVQIETESAVIRKKICFCDQE